MKELSCIVIALLLASFTGCSDDEGDPAKPRTHDELCEPGDTINSHIGDEFEIIRYNPVFDSGYRWNFSKNFNSEIVELIEYRVEERFPGRFGSPMWEIWKYESLSKGTTCASMKCDLSKWGIDEGAIYTKSYVSIIR
jgi:predicted secreted protein